MALGRHLTGLIYKSYFSNLTWLQQEETKFVEQITDFHQYTNY